MSSKIAKTGGQPRSRSAAWRISLWGTLAFACGTLVVFLVLNNFVAHDIQRRTDAWLTGEVETLGDVAQRTPKGRLYGRVVGEVAELASREVPESSGRPRVLTSRSSLCRRQRMVRRRFGWEPGTDIRR